EFRVFKGRMSTYSATQLILRADVQVDEDILHNEEFVNDFSTLLDRGNTVMNSYSVTPITEADTEIHKATEELIQQSRKVNGLLEEMLIKSNRDIIRAEEDLLSL